MNLKIYLSVIGMLFISIVFVQRDTIAVNNDWQFKIDKSNEGISGKWFENNLSNARPVSLAPRWNIEPGTEMYYDLAWYQKKINIPAVCG